jgi:hypothetical protein
VVKRVEKIKWLKGKEWKNVWHLTIQMSHLPLGEQQIYSNIFYKFAQQFIQQFAQTKFLFKSPPWFSQLRPRFSHQICTIFSRALYRCAHAWYSHLNNFLIFWSHFYAILVDYFSTDIKLSKSLQDFLFILRSGWRTRWRTGNCFNIKIWRWVNVILFSH